MLVGSFVLSHSYLGSPSGPAAHFRSRAPWCAGCLSNFSTTRRCASLLTTCPTPRCRCSFLAVPFDCAGACLSRRELYQPLGECKQLALNQGLRSSHWNTVGLHAGKSNLAIRFLQACAMINHYTSALQAALTHRCENQTLHFACCLCRSIALGRRSIARGVLD